MCSTRQRLAALLREQRELHGLTLRQAAARARLSPSTLSRWEAGTYLPRIPELESLLRALGVEPDDVKRILVSLDAPRAAKAAKNLCNETGIAPSGGALLRAIRKKAGKPLVEVAVKLGVSASTVSRWEASEAHLSAKAAEQLMDILGASEEERACLIASGVAKIKTERPDFDIEKFRSDLASIEAVLPSGGDGGTELRLLQLQSLLWWWSRQPDALQLLARAHLAYARFLMLWKRFPEAISEAETATASGALNDVSIATALRVIARCEVHRWMTPRPHLGLYILQRALQSAVDNQARAEILVDMSEFSQLAGRFEDSLGYAERAVVAANLSGDEEAQWKARLAYGSILGAVGRKDEAHVQLRLEGDSVDRKLEVEAVKTEPLPRAEDEESLIYASQLERESAKESLFPAQVPSVN